MLVGDQSILLRIFKRDNTELLKLSLVLVSVLVYYINILYINILVYYISILYINKYKYKYKYIPV